MSLLGWLALALICLAAVLAVGTECYWAWSRRKRSREQEREWITVLDDIRTTLKSQDREEHIQDVLLRNESRKALLDQVCRVTADSLHAPAAVITVVEYEGQRWLAYYGAEWCSEETRAGLSQPLETSYCQYVVTTGQPLSVTDSFKDIRLVNNDPQTRAMVRAYLGAPVFSEEGVAIGSLCVFHYKPRNWSAKDRATIQAYAETVVL